MTRNYANISTAIWRDEDFRALSVGAQHAYFLLATQPDISAAGVLPMTLGRWSSRASNSNIDTLEEALDELVQHRFIFLDRDTEELLVRSFVKWDGGYSNPKRQRVIERAGQEVESDALRRAIAVEFRKVGLSTAGMPPDEQEATVGPDMSGGGAPHADLAFPQANSLSDRHPDTVSASDGVVVTKALVVVPQPTTLNNQPPVGLAVETAAGGPNAGAQPGSFSVRSWNIDNHQPRTEGTRIPRQPSLFDVRRAEIDKSVETHKIIGHWLQANGYPNVSLDDCRAVHQAIRQKHSGVKDLLGYIRGIAGGSGFYGYYQPIIEARADSIEKQVRSMTVDQPGCDHGQPGGQLPHPTTGLALCPLCRIGTPATTVRLGETTHPDVQAALDVYRTAYGATPRLPLLMTITAEAETLRRRGFAPNQLADLAAIAGRAGTGLLDAARSLKGQAA